MTFGLMRNFLSLLIPVFLSSALFSQQSTLQQIQESELELRKIRDEQQAIVLKIENLRLQEIREQLSKVGNPELRPGDEPVKHLAMNILYSEEHEQAHWVSHVILPEIRNGAVGRTNDFRPDSMISTGSAVEQDYFIKDTLPDGSFKYDGFGFDRGHLAPSADFRWSLSALSESYLYSNMSPQKAEFNRDSWAKLEDLLRAYVSENNVPLYVVTGPVLRDNLPKIERGLNKVSIPFHYFKAAWDPQNKRMIAFVMPNRLCEAPLETYAVNVDSVESLSGFNFFPSAGEAEEKTANVKPWLRSKEQNDVTPLKANELPKNHFNTVQAKLYSGKNERVTVCGTVVSTKLSSKGNVFLNLDKGFPNQIFTVTIFKDQMVNFSYAPHEFLDRKTICVSGKITDFNGTPSMQIENEEAIRFFDADGEEP
jgi:endonuclease G